MPFRALAYLERFEGRQTPCEPPVPHLCHGVLGDRSAGRLESGRLPSTWCALAQLILSQPWKIDTVILSILQSRKWRLRAMT